MKQLYLLSLFYPSLGQAEFTVRAAKDAIEELSGNDYRVLDKGTQHCVIGFASELTHDAVQEKMRQLPASAARYLLLEVGEVLAATILENSQQWLERHRRK